MKILLTYHLSTVYFWDRYSSDFWLCSSKLILGTWLTTFFDIVVPLGQRAWYLFFFFIILGFSVDDRRCSEWVWEVNYPHLFVEWSKEVTLMDTLHIYFFEIFLIALIKGIKYNWWAWKDNTIPLIYTLPTWKKLTNTDWPTGSSKEMPRVATISINANAVLAVSGIPKSRFNVAMTQSNN